MKTLLDLANKIEALDSEIQKAASDTAVGVALAIVGDLSYRTPVDTSKALSNWRVTLDAPATGNIDAHYQGEKGSTQGASAAQSIADAKRVLRNKRPGQAIFITNNLPYIRRLNDGYSKQAPSGFVERAVLIGRKMKTRFKLKG